MGLGHVYPSHPPKRGGGNPARSGSEGAPQLGEGFPPLLNASPGRECCLCPSCPGATWQPRRRVPQCRGLGRTAVRGGAGAQAEALWRGVWTTAHLLVPSVHQCSWLPPHAGTAFPAACATTWPGPRVPGRRHAGSRPPRGWGASATAGEQCSAPASAPPGGSPAE